MTEVVVDTGPVLHLHQISELSALGIFARLEIPKRVVEELGHYGLNVQALSNAGQLPQRGAKNELQPANRSRPMTQYSR